MEQLVYERPREKVRNRGITSLSSAELIQLIIGSGNGKASAARIAREVENAMNSKRAITYSALLAINGIGDAKACQLLAVIELAYRHSLSAGTNGHK